MRSPPPRAPHTHRHHDHDHGHGHGHDHDHGEENDEVQLPGLKELPELIHRAVQRQADKYKGKKPHQIMSATQWRAANTHNEGLKANKRKPPKGLVTTDGVHFFSSIRVLNFFERTKNNLVKQQAEVLNRSHLFNERDMNTFTQLWEEKALLEGDIDKLRDEVVMRSRTLDCDCDLDRHVNHLRATRQRNKLIQRLKTLDHAEASRFENRRLMQEKAEEAYRKYKASYSDGLSTERPRSPPKALPPPSGLLDLPRVETMYELQHRKQLPAPLCSFISSDVYIVDTKIIQYLVRVFQEAVDVVNDIADKREEKAKREEEERKKKREEMLALAKAAEEAAMVSSSDEEIEEDVDKNDVVKTKAKKYMAMCEEEDVANQNSEKDAGTMGEEADDDTDEDGADDDEEVDEDEDEDEDEEDSMYAFSEHSSDFADEFDEETYGTTQLNIDGPGLEDDEDDYVTSLMEGAIVRMTQSIVPPTWFKLISEALELLNPEVRSRARFVDLTGSTGATSILTAMWLLGFASLVTYEKDYEDLVLARMYVRAVKACITGVGYNGEKIDRDNGASSGSESSSSSEEEDNDDHNDPIARGRRLLRQQREKKKREGTSYDERIKSNEGVVDPSLLPKEYQKNELCLRLACVSSKKKDWDWDSADPWISGPWKSADIVFIDENMYQFPCGCAEELHSIVQTKDWVHQNYDDESIKRLAVSFCGRNKVYGGGYTGEEVLSTGELQLLLEELDKLDDERIDQLCKLADRQTWEYFSLHKSLRRRSNVHEHLLKLKDNALIIVICPERDIVPCSEDEIREQNGPELTSGEENEDEDDAKKERKGKVRSQNDNNDAFGTGPEGLKTKVNISSNFKSEKKMGATRKVIPKQERRSSLLASYGQEEEEAKVRTWERPTPEMRSTLRARWLNKTLFQDDTTHFDHIDDNFVFRNMAKQSMWNGGPAVSGVLYRRISRALVPKDHDSDADRSNDADNIDNLNDSDDSEYA